MGRGEFIPFSNFAIFQTRTNDNLNLDRVIEVINYNTDNWYKLRFDYFWKGSKLWIIYLELNTKKKVTWFYERTNCSFTDQQTDWVRVRAIFKI